jgi:hypothetical protein
MIRGWIFLLLIACLAVSLPAQNLHVRVTDGDSGEPLQGVSLSCKRGQPLGVTDDKGDFRGQVPCDTVWVEYLGYEPRRVLANGRPQQLALVLSAIELAPTVITDGALPVVADPLLHVVDYNFAGQWLVMLTVNHKTRQRELLWSLPDGSSPGSFREFDESPQGFATDCMGNTYLLSATYAWQMRITQGRLTLSPMLRTTYDEYLTSCQASLGTAHFYKFQKTLQLMHFVFTPKPEAPPQLLTSIADTHARAVLHDDQLLASKGIKPYGDMAPQQADFQSQLDKLYVKYIDAPPIDVPMFTLGGLVRLFDHANGYIQSFDATGVRKELVKINYHENKRWEPIIIPCPERQMAYTVLNRSGMYRLVAINLATGEAVEGAELPHRFPQNIRVRDGWVFYQYQDAMYDPVKRLYRMRVE